MILSVFKKCLPLLTLSVMLACASNPDAPQFVGSEEFIGGVDNIAPSESDNTITPQTVDQLVSALSFPGADGDEFQAPTSGDREAFQQLVAEILAGNTTGHQDTLDSLGYQLVVLSTDSDNVVSLEESGTTGGGTYLFNLSTDSELILQVPHPVSATNTLEQGAFIFQNLRAQALFIAGTHRCNSTTESSCSGTTTACGATAAYRSSDVAHATDNFFHAAHKAASTLASFPKIIQLHGFAEASGDPDAVVSNGTEQKVGAFAYVNQLESELETQLAANTVTSCNKTGDPLSTLCGLDNVQGRYTNGSADECTENPTSITGRFTHIQQASSLRDSNNESLLSDALNAVF